MNYRGLISVDDGILVYDSINGKIVAKFKERLDPIHRQVPHSYCAYYDNTVSRNKTRS